MYVCIDFKPDDILSAFNRDIQTPENCITLYSVH